MAPQAFDEGDGEMNASDRRMIRSGYTAEPNEETSLLVMVPIDTGSSNNSKSFHHISSNKSYWNNKNWPYVAQREMVVQFKSILPILCSNILTKLPWFITLYILGEMDNGTFLGGDGEQGSSGGVELAGAALATSLFNVTGMSLSVGFSFALSTLAGQAKGEMESRANNNNNNNNNVGTVVASNTSSKYAIRGAEEGGLHPANSEEEEPAEDPYSTPNMPVMFYLRGLVAQLMLVLPVGIWWLHGIETLLIKLGQTPDMAAHAATYLKILAPALWAYSIQWTTAVLTYNIGMADVPAKASVLGFALHIPFNILFCYYMGLGYLGCAYATFAFQAVQCTYILSYLFLHPKGRNRVLELSGGAGIGRKTLTLLPEFMIAVGSLRGFIDFLALALPGLVIISEWWASETAIFLSGRLNPDPQTTLAAMTIYQGINSFCFMIPAGFSTAGSARIGNLLGAGNPEGASMAAKVSVALCAICSGTIGFVLYVFPHNFFPSLFVSEEENEAIVEQTAAVIPLLAFYVFADGVQVGLNGVIKACGRQKIIVPIVVVAYWLIGVPLGYYLGLYRNGGDDTLCADAGGTMVLCGDVGLVFGATTGTWCHMLMLVVAVVGTTDWKKEAFLAQQRVADDRTHKKRHKRQKQQRWDSEREVNKQQKMKMSRSDGAIC